MKLGIFLVAFTLSTLGSSAPNLLDKVPLVRQSTEYSCGAAALQSVLAFYGVSLNESQIMKGVGTQPDSGSQPAPIAAFAQAKGLTSELKHGATLDDLERNLSAGRPVLADIQAWSDDAAQSKPYADIWDSGHYVVVIGIDDKNVYLMDPVLLGSRGVLARANFVERWHDVDGEHTAIFFRGTPQPPKIWEAVP